MKYIENFLMNDIVFWIIIIVASLLAMTIVGKFYEKEKLKEGNFHEGMNRAARRSMRKKRGRADYMVWQKTKERH